MTYDHNTTFDRSIEQTISVPLRPGDTICLFKEAESSDKYKCFDDTVDRYNPNTGLLEFHGSDVGRAEFLALLTEADGISIFSE